jgi:SAM-dependent methyltransferase
MKTKRKHIPDRHEHHENTIYPPVVNGAIPAPPLKLDLGCGSNKRQDNGPWIGVDGIAFPGVDVVCNLVEIDYITTNDNPPRRKPWPWPDNSVAEAHSSHFLEHLDSWERVHFFNELYRILIPGGKCQIIVPHWASCRAYGDPSHKWPPVSEFAFMYLSREWRLGNQAKGLGANAPHTDVAYRPDGFSCDFGAVWGYSIHPHWQNRVQDAQQFASGWYKEAIQDLFCTVTKQ